MVRGEGLEAATAETPEGFVPRRTTK